MVADDEYEAGRLPTEEQLADDFKVSRQTVRRAMQDLVAEGLVYRVRGRGTFPAPRRGHCFRQNGSLDDLLAMSADTVMEILHPPRLHIDADAAARLRSASDRVVTLSFRRLTQGVPFCYTTVHLRAEIGHVVIDHPDLQQPGRTSLRTVIGLIEDKLAAANLIEADQSISVAGMSAAAADALRCEIGSPAMRIDRTYRDVRQDPLEVATSYFRPDLYSYRVTVALQHRNSV